MAEPRFADEDDLPRTFRRERDAREREMREREQPAADYHAAEAPRGSGQSYGRGDSYEASGYGYDDGTPPPGTVTRFDVPFGHMVLFFVKAALAALPALLLLAVLFWGVGQGLKSFFPGLRHFEVVIRTPK